LIRVPAKAKAKAKGKGKGKGAVKRDVWLLTDVLDSARLSVATAAMFYRWRWRNEGVFRTDKRTINKLKLSSRTVRLVVCRACSTAWGCKSPTQPDGGEVLAKRKGVAARRGLKEAWSKTAT
jgi:hypothetical protein